MVKHEDYKKSIEKMGGVDAYQKAGMEKRLQDVAAKLREKEIEALKKQLFEEINWLIRTQEKFINQNKHLIEDEFPRHARKSDELIGKITGKTCKWIPTLPYLMDQIDVNDLNKGINTLKSTLETLRRLSPEKWI